MWFHTEVLSHRCALSLLWMLLLQKVVLDTLVLFLKIFSWHPILGFQDWLYFVFGWKSLFHHLLLSATCTIFAIFHMHSHEVKQRIFATRFEIVRTWLSLQQLLRLSLLSVLGGVSAYSCFKLLGGVGFSGYNKSYLSQRFTLECWQDIFFVVSHGFYAGALFCIRYFSNDWNLLEFPLNEQLKLSAFRGKVKEILYASMSSIFGIMHWFYILSLICGFYFGDKVSWLVGEETSMHFSSRIYHLFNINLFLVTIVTGTLLYFIWSSCIFIFSLFATERFEFLINAITNEDKDKVLTKALSCPDLSLFKYLAFLDMRWLSQFSQPRRKKFFSISQPGGHPHHWIALYTVSMQILNTLLENLEKLSCPKLVDQHKYHLNVRHNMFIVREEEKSNPHLISIYSKKLQNYIMGKPLAQYFFIEFPDVEALKLFTGCQLEIWTIEALGFFVAASYAEDNYGVIQKSLPKILSTLIDLKLCEEKLPVGVMSFKKYAKDSKPLHTGVLQRHCLKSAIESALYRIVLTFKTDIRGVFLPEKYKRHLERYLEFMK